MVLFFTNSEQHVFIILDCRKFEDIIGFERLNSLIALTAINNGYLKVASNALVKLENEDDGYAEISYNLFKDQSPKNIDISVIECPG